MGRHSRKGPRAKGPDTDAAAGGDSDAAGSGRRRRAAAAPAPGDGHASFHDIPQARGGHPEQREPGGGWGAGPQQWHGDRQGPERPAAGGQGAVPGPQGHLRQAAPRTAARRLVARPPVGGGPLIPGPRREFVDAFDVTAGGEHIARPDSDGTAGPAVAPERSEGTGRSGASGDGTEGPAQDGEGAAGRDGKGGKGRTFTGIAAAAVTTVLAVVVAGQVAQDSDGGTGSSRASGVGRDGSEDASRSVERATPQAPQAQKAEAEPPSYADAMAKAYPLAPNLTGTGKFAAVAGLAKAPGKGEKYRYRVDVEEGLGLDAGLFAEAVHKTLNDDRSWAHNGAMTFERVQSGEVRFVITLASPGTTGFWCEKSGLDTTQDNVSCDSAATDRVMINAYRWAQGASTFGPEKLMAYRQMLINHEVGHRLGHNHVNCRTPGALAPVMQQQTKTLDINGIKCRTNAWVYPGE